MTGTPENYYSEVFDSIVLGKETPNGLELSRSAAQAWDHFRII
jgi:hypothetical protein